MISVKNINVGDTVYCKKFKKGDNTRRDLRINTKCIILKIHYISESILVKIKNTDDTYSFHIGKYQSYYFNYCDYFYTVAEYRKEKLKKLNELFEKI